MSRARLREGESIHACFQDDEVVAHRDFRGGPDVLERDGYFLTRRDLESIEVVFHFVVGVNRDLLGRRHRALRATGEGKKERTTTERPAVFSIRHRIRSRRPG